MFRRLSNSLPKDPEYPCDLESLGYFINDKHEIRQVANPDKEFEFFITKNERYNEKHREAMHSCLRSNILNRFSDLGLTQLRLPRAAGPKEKHIPILTSSDLQARERIILVLNEASQDLGVFAWRDTRSERGNLYVGSAIDFVKEAMCHASNPPRDSEDQAGAAEEIVRSPETATRVLEHDVSDSPGIVIANPGQLIWHRRGKQAMTLTSWFALPRKSAVHGPMLVDEVGNRVPGHEDYAAHLASVFGEVIDPLIFDKAKDEEVPAIDIIALTDGALEIVRFLDDNWHRYSPYISALALGGPLHNSTSIRDAAFATFLTRRARAYVISHLPAGTPIDGSFYGCNTYSSGEAEIAECIMGKAYPMMLDFFDEVAMNPAGYTNPEVFIFDDDGDGNESEKEDSIPVSSQV